MKVTSHGQIEHNKLIELTTEEGLLAVDTQTNAIELAIADTYFKVTGWSDFYYITVNLSIT